MRPSAASTELLTELESAKGIRGIVFISGKPENFLAGANLKLISQIEIAPTGWTGRWSISTAPSTG